MNRYKYFIFDMNNLFFRSFWVYNHEKDKYIFKQNDEDIKEDIIKNYAGSIVKTFDTIKNFIKYYGYEKDSIVYLTFDNPLSAHQIRKVISNGQYKHGRYNKNVPKALYGTLNLFEHIATMYSDNFRIVKNEKMEADDLTKPIIDSLELNKHDKCLCVSTDLDWARNMSLNENVNWLNYERDKNNHYVIYNREVFKNKFGYSPVGEKIRLYKAFKGDNSDNIEVGLKSKKGTAKERDELVLYIVNNYDNLEDVLHCMFSDKNISSAWCKEINDVKRTLIMNYQLTGFIELEENLKSITTVCKENIQGLRVWYKSLKLDLEPRMIENKDAGFFNSYDYS